MTSIPSAVLSAAAELLPELDGVPPSVAAARTRQLAQQHPDLVLDLVHDSESYDGSTSYQLLVRTSDGRTWSVGLAAAAELPWPLRGVTRSSEHHLLRVDGRTVEVSEAIAALDHVWADEHLLQRIVDAALIAAAVDERHLDLDDEQLQRATDAFRRAKGLTTQALTQAWLAAHGMSFQRLVDLARSSAVLAQLRRQLIADRGLPDRGQLRAELADVDIAWAARTDPDTLAADPGAAVLAAFSDGHDAGLQRWPATQLPDRFARLKDAPVGQPVDVGDGVFALVLARHDVEDSSVVQQAAERMVFEQWLAEQRAAAEIEWFWGRERETAAR
jgi:putative peptide maturation system protein